MKTHNLDFFLERIGKKIYRDKSSCDCKTCQDSYENGIIIADSNHAKYLHTIEHDFASEGEFLNYRDTKKFLTK